MFKSLNQWRKWSRKVGKIELKVSEWLCLADRLFSIVSYGDSPAIEDKMNNCFLIMDHYE